MRSPFLMSRGDSGLLVIDVQEKLMAKVPGREHIASKIALLAQGAKILGVPIQATEQYPKGLGPTIPELVGLLPPRLEKLSFSCGVLPEITTFFQAGNIRNVLLAGIEAHVCVLQTALDLVARDFRVYLAVDAVGSRHPEDLQTALRRMERSGVVLTTTEAALFEWLEQAGTREFKQISRLIVESDPKNPF
jgi:nicotinamidase-related amidase